VLAPRLDGRLAIARRFGHRVVDGKIQAHVIEAEKRQP
jgi:hypothetical protein